jgi:transcriptional regulator with XRE-family HTH domain
MKLTALYEDENGRLAAAYRKTGKSQSELARSVGVHKSTISRYKRSKSKKGMRNPSLATLKRLKAAGVDVVNAFGLSGGSGGELTGKRGKKARSKG